MGLDVACTGSAYFAFFFLLEADFRRNAMLQIHGSANRMGHSTNAENPQTTTDNPQTSSPHVTTHPAIRSE